MVCISSWVDLVAPITNTGLIETHCRLTDYRVKYSYGYICISAETIRYLDWDLVHIGSFHITICWVAGCTNEAWRWFAFHVARPLLASFGIVNGPNSPGTQPPLNFLVRLVTSKCYAGYLHSDVIAHDGESCAIMMIWEALRQEARAHGLSWSKCALGPHLSQTGRACHYMVVRTTPPVDPGYLGVVRGTIITSLFDQGHYVYAVESTLPNGPLDGLCARCGWVPVSSLVPALPSAVAFETAHARRAYRTRLEATQYWHPTQGYVTLVEFETLERLAAVQPPLSE